MLGEVSVVITTFNWPESLVACVLCLLHQRVLPRQIVVADDGSGESTQRAVHWLQGACASRGVELKHVWHPDQGYRRAAILNRAFNVVTQPYVIQMDCDCLAEPHFIADHLNVKRSGCFVAGSRVSLSSERSRRILFLLDVDAIDVFNLGLHDGNTPAVASSDGGQGDAMALRASGESFAVNIDALSKRIMRMARGELSLNALRCPMIRDYLAPRYMQSRGAYYLRGCNMAFWHEDLVRINGYDARYEGWGQEDNEIAQRLLNAGLRKRFLKLGGVLYHLYHNERPREQQEQHFDLLRQSAEEGWIRAEQGMEQC